MIKQMEEEKLEYINLDNKKIWISTYLLNKNFLDKYIKDYSQQQILISENGDMAKQKIGYQISPTFFCQRSFLTTIVWIGIMEILIMHHNILSL